MGRNWSAFLVSVINSRCARDSPVDMLVFLSFFLSVFLFCPINKMDLDLHCRRQVCGKYLVTYLFPTRAIVVMDEQAFCFVSLSGERRM